MADGHKWMLGPEGLGVFYSSPAAREQLRLTQYGWHMMHDTHNYENKPWDIHPTAQRFECGSPNTLGIHALSASLSVLLDTGMATVEKQVLANARYLMDAIQSHPRLELLTDASAKLQSGIVVFKHTQMTQQALYAHLQENHVVCAMRGGGIRFSAHFYNLPEELDAALALIPE